MNITKKLKSKKSVLIGAMLALIAATGVYLGWSSYKDHVRLMENIKIAMANPGGLQPGELINRIDKRFAGLSQEEKQKILSDPRLLSERIEKASYENYKQAFEHLFMLPAPLRAKLIRTSADSISTALTRNPGKVNAFYESEAGKAALRAASGYFMTELDGRQKSELKPITDAFFKLHKERAQKQGN